MEVINKETNKQITTQTTKNQLLDGLKSRVETTEYKADKIRDGSIEFNWPEQLRVNRLEKMNKATHVREKINLKNLVFPKISKIDTSRNISKNKKNT